VAMPPKSIKALAHASNDSFLFIGILPLMPRSTRSRVTNGCSQRVDYARPGTSTVREPWPLLEPPS